MEETSGSGPGNRRFAGSLVRRLPGGNFQRLRAASASQGPEQLFQDAANRRAVAGRVDQLSPGDEGISIAFVLAFLLGMIRALLPSAGGYYEYVVQFFRNVPPLSMIPLLILWCGIGETTKTVIIVLASFFPMYLNIVKGFTGCDRKLLEVGDMFGYSRTRKFMRIVLPYATADILVGMRIGLGYSWRAIMRRDGGRVHRAGAHDPVRPADVQDRQGDRGHPGDRRGGLWDGPCVRIGHRQITERTL